MLLTVWTEVLPPDYCVNLLFPADDSAVATCEYSRSVPRRLISQQLGRFRFVELQDREPRQTFAPEHLEKRKAPPEIPACRMRNEKPPLRERLCGESITGTHAVAALSVRDCSEGKGLHGDPLPRRQNSRLSFKSIQGRAATISAGKRASGGSEM